MFFPSQVLDYTENDTSSVDGLKVAVDKAVALLKKQGLLSGQNVGQIFSSVSKKLNSQSDEANKANRQKVIALSDYRHIKTTFV